MGTPSARGLLSESRKLRWTLGVATLASVALTLWIGGRMVATRHCLQTPSAPRAMISLTLARSPAEARGILTEWHEPPVVGCPGGPIAVARATLAEDQALIAAYTAALVLLTLLVACFVRLPRRLLAATVVAAGLAGVCDLIENARLEVLLEAGRGAAIDPRVLAVARGAAQTKFALLLAVLAVLGTAILGGVRRVLRTRDVACDARRDFLALVTTEMNAIAAASNRRGPSAPVVARRGCGEPRVTAVGHDFVGLALSGGGIRSATFNLGLLAGLDRLGALERVDYLSTVSGGGYVGSFWTAWLRRERQRLGRKPPSWPPAEEGVDNRAIRHLREFSRFLAPRRGFFEAEMWQAVVSLLAGLIPSFMAAASVIGIGLVGWLIANFFMACPHPLAGVLAVVGITIGVLALLERWWAADAGLDARDARVGRRVNAWSAVFATGLVAAWQYAFAHTVWPAFWLRLAGGWIPIVTFDGAYATWWGLTGITSRHLAPDAWFLSPRLFDLAVVWLAAGATMLVLRPVAALLLRQLDAAAAASEPAALAGDTVYRRVGLPAYDRSVMRLLGSALAWAVVAAVWHLSVNLQIASRLVVAFLLSAGSFAALRNWMGIAFRTGQQPGPLDWVKPKLPQLLAYLTTVLMIGGVGSVLIAWGGTDWFAWWIAVAVMSTAIVAMLLLDPAATGLHAFYRDRIVRAYSGAVNPNGGNALASRDEPGPSLIPLRNLQSDPRRDDDLGLAELPPRPLHLVCCAANDLRGDQVETLGRGARSAVLSRNGVSIGDHAGTLPGLTLGAAVTASAAAFNSNMGTVSTTLGPVVAFLMSALNLRLGLWVPNPTEYGSKQPRLLPGQLFFREMFSATRADAKVREVHLSDGGHFENLALYELIRRHCRYVIVSDCGEDPHVAFEDFGNAARRIREDFGVQIEIDLCGLRPNAERRSLQHVVVGTIHYTDFDKGILLYVKPTLNGDEPPDVLQYATRNRNFPHEPTSDQFYDEAQWESYRKLGEHTACTVFGFLDRQRAEAAETASADWLFTNARQEWYPTPPHLEARVLEMTERFGAVETALQEMPHATMLSELFPELATFRGAANPQRSAATNGPESEAANLVCVVRMMQLMEDVWARCELDTSWNHPLNLGWINCFARWASAPTFRMWWPLLRPMYGPRFQRFMEERFCALECDAARQGALSGPHTAPRSGVASHWLRERDVLAGREGLQGGTYYDYEIELVRGHTTTTMQVGIAVLRHEREASGDVVWWTSDDFVVPPSLWGAGIGGSFIRALLNVLDERGAPCRVFVRAPRERNDPGSWHDRLHYVEFYKKEGFRLVEEVDCLPDGSGPGERQCRAIRLDRLPRPPASTQPGVGSRFTGRDGDGVPHLGLATAPSRDDGHPIADHDDGRTPPPARDPA